MAVNFVLGRSCPRAAPDSHQRGARAQELLGGPAHDTYTCHQALPSCPTPFWRARSLSGSSLWGAVLPFHPGPIKTLWSSSFVRCLASLSSSDTKSPLIGRAVFWACRAKRPAANPWGLAWLVRLVFFTREVPACRVFISVGDPRINEVKPREEASLDGGDVASASPAARGRQVWRL